MIKKSLLIVFFLLSMVTSPIVFATDSVLTLDTTDSLSGFAVQDSSAATVIRAGGDGNVGIGTTTPGNSLHVKRTDGDVISKFETSLVDGNAWIGMQNDARTFLLGLRGDTSDNFTIYDNDAGADRIVIKVNGNVGIGTNNPQGTLDVNGAIYQRGGSLHADYVFESNYKLESILEHSAFMWKNKHLAAIPDFRVDHNGQEVVEVGAHRKGIVEELEKAHIYIEQLYKHNKKLVEQNKKMAEQNKALDVRLARIESMLSE